MLSTTIVRGLASLSQFGFPKSARMYWRTRTALSPYSRWTSPWFSRATVDHPGGASSGWPGDSTSGLGRLIGAVVTSVGKLHNDSTTATATTSGTPAQTCFAASGSTERSSHRFGTPRRAEKYITTLTTQIAVNAGTC